MSIVDEVVYYKYAAKDMLTYDITTIAYSHYSHVCICAYRVNTDGIYPFMELLLHSDKTPTEFNLPHTIVPSGGKVIYHAKGYLSNILNIPHDSSNYDYEGVYLFNRTLYIFFEMPFFNTGYDMTYAASPIRFAIFDEIINRHNVCNIPISNIASSFFIHNPSFMYLLNKTKAKYELPIVGYVGKVSPDKVQFAYIFREIAKNKQAILGPYFYFTNLNYAVKQCIRNSKGGGGVVRFALFTGNPKYIENFPHDPIDNSLIKQERLIDPSLDTHYEKMTIRISDHDGLWATTYDSVYLGRLELEDGSILDEPPSVVLKSYSQQVPLSYHFIDTSNMVKEEVFNDNTVCTIA